MSLSARLHIEGHKREKLGIRVLECDFEFSQSVDERGCPSSIVRGGKINIMIAVENDGEILHWMLNEVDKNGRIIFTGKENGKSLKTIEFTNGRLIYYKEYFKDQTEVKVNLTVSAQIMSVAGEKQENTWPGYFLK